MFGMLKSLAKAATAIVDVPVSLAADIITLGGSMTDQDKPYTAQAASRLVQNVKDAADPERDE